MSLRNKVVWAMHGFSLASLVLGTHIWVLGLIGIFLMMISLLQKDSWTLRKVWAYGAVIPFALWWLLAPTENVHRIGPISVWVLWIPGWYFWYLGWLQLVTLEKGGEKRFLWWNSAMALALGQGAFEWSSWVVSIPWTALLLMDLRIVAVGKRNPWRISWVMRWSLSVGLMLLVWFFQASLEAQFWKMAYRSSTNRYNRMMMRGFEPTSWLGSFQSEFESPYEREVALRVYSAAQIPFIRAMTYTEYASGVWRSASLDDWKFPVRNMVEYGVYADSASVSNPDIWIQPLLRDFGYLFLPPGVTTVAILADSLATDNRGTWRKTTGERTGSYWVGSVRAESEIPLAKDLFVSRKLRPFLDSLNAAWLIAQSSKDSLKVTLDRIKGIFARDFDYALKLPPSDNEDPLRSFFQHHKGYCEYFATASVLILRQAGIPSRYATGFAYPRKQANAWVFRRSDAHAWVEVWDGESWIQFDPTPPSYRPNLKDWTKWEAFREQLSSRIDEFVWTIQFGSWKLLVDQLGAFLMGLFSWRIGAIFILSLIALLGGLFLKNLKRQSRLYVTSNKAHWVQKLTDAEQKLAIQGFGRVHNETVADWLERIPNSADPEGIQILKEYQKHRFEKDEGLPRN